MTERDAANPYGGLSALSDGALDALIRQEMTTEGEPNVELLDAIYDELKARGQVAEVDTDAAWAAFAAAFLDGGDRSAREKIEAAAARLPEPPQPAPPSRRSRKVLRRLSAAAIVAVGLLIGGSITAAAAGVDLVQLLFSWNADVLFLSGSDGDALPTDTATYTAAAQDVSDEIAEDLLSLQEMLTNRGYPANMAPTWLPEDLTDGEFSEVEALDGIWYVYLRYPMDDGTFSVSFYVVMGDETLEIQKNEGTPEVITRGDVTFYLFGNMEKTVIVYTYGSYLCKISGIMSQETAYQIIESVPLE